MDRHGIMCWWFDARYLSSYVSSVALSRQLNALCVVALVYGPLGELQIAYILRETLKGLDYLHKNGKMHRDVKVSASIRTKDSPTIFF